MESTLPFEYGFLYKIIDNYNQGEVTSSLKIDDSVIWYNNGGYNTYGTTYNNGIDNTKYFNPVGYIASKQQIILEIIVLEKEVISNLLQMSGMSFSTSSLEKHNSKIVRANIDVNIFIRNFEKVL